MKIKEHFKNLKEKIPKKEKNEGINIKKEKSELVKIKEKERNEQYKKIKKRKPLEDIINQESNRIDKYIINLVKKENLKYIDGSLCIEINSKSLELNLKLYFQDNQGEWIIHSKENNVDIEEILQNDDLEILKRKRKIEYEIESPIKGEM